MEKAIEMILAAGFIKDRITRPESHKIITRYFYPSAGVVLTAVARPKFARGDWRVTVGKRTTYFWSIAPAGHYTGQFKRLKTSDLAGIEAFLELNKQ